MPHSRAQSMPGGEAAQPGRDGVPTGVPSQQPAAPSIEPQTAVFAIDAFDVVGNTLLDELTVDATVLPFGGPDRTVSDIDAARAALEKQYRDRGFDSVIVNAETPDQFAIVRLQVIETRVGTVSVKGARFASEAVVRQQLAEIEPGKVPNFRRVERQISEANRHFANREITLLPRAGAAPGTIDVEARVTDTLPLTASLEVNNNRNRDTAPLRFNASIGHTDLWGRGHRLSFGFGVAPERPSNSQILSAGYVAPILGSPWSLSLNGLRSTSNTALSLGSQTVIGNGYTIGGRAQYEIPVVGSTAQVIRFGADFKDYKQDISATIGGALTQQFPRLRWLSLVGDYVVQQSSERATSSLTVSLSTGVRAGSQQQVEIDNPEAFLPLQPPTIFVPAFQYTRADARGNYTKLSAEAVHTQSVLTDLVLVGRAQGQISDTPLLPNEQFSIGGFYTVRGYLVGEAVGDNGIVGTLEVRSPDYATPIGEFVDSARYFVFVDGGLVRTLRVLPQQSRGTPLASFGIGARLELFKTLTGEVVGAVPLRDGEVTRRGDPRVNFSVRAGF
ncbi:MAG: ShlB/FhaC/HecB family hemolysin secretion/activation protein [Sphingomonadaceae bacterium]